jgi:hypothetical protein
MVKKLMICIGILGIHSGGLGSKIELDPMIDFRYPVSLFEMLHEGIVQITYMIKRTEYNEQSLNHLIDALINLHYRYDSSLELQLKRDIKSVDKEFLEQMLQRIDDLIAQLEGDNTNRSCAQVLCQRLRDKIMHS